MKKKYIELLNKIIILKRDFHLKLHPTTEHNFANEFVEVTGEKLDVNDLVNFYEGVLLDEPDTSRVTGSLNDGIFHGTVDSKKHGRFYIESAKRFNRTSNAHSIIYHENDIIVDKTRLKKRSVDDEDLVDEAYHVGCGARHGDIHKQMKEIQKKLYTERKKVEVSYKKQGLN